MDISGKPANVNDDTSSLLDLKMNFKTKDHFENNLPNEPPACKNQLYPEGAVNLPINSQYTANLTIPDPWTMSNSVEQYNQTRVNNWINEQMKAQNLHPPDYVSQRYSQPLNNLNEGFILQHHRAHTWYDITNGTNETKNTRFFITLLLIALLMYMFIRSGR